MQIVELKVNVEKSQLSQLEAQVKALQNKRITLKVDTTGIDTKALNALANYNKGLAANQKAKAQVVAANAKIVESNNKVRIAQEKTLQAQYAVTKEMNRTTQSFNKVRQETEKTTQSYNKAAQEQLRYQRQVEKSTQAQNRANRAMENTTSGTAKAAKEVSTFQRLMGGSLGEITARMAAWQVMGTVVSAPIRAMKEALSTMKEVDSQLVVIQKTTNFSNQQMKEIEQQAYKTASAYGQSADSYLESVAAFARAGYKEQASQLGELAIKTQLVGDTTAEVADQFLLSVDKAYKYNGSVTELMKVLDGADYINNNYATSVEKIAEGMGIVAPVAYQAHVGVDELMASIGTITAVTQRSGSEAARALRALFLNIIGDTQTEIEDGAKWTAGEIEGLRDVLRKFAPDVVAAADAAKEVINPMEAMSALSKAMKEGALSEQQLMEMVSDIGGKLRTSQLLAIIENWDMYESMLSDYQKAAGTADKEIEHILGSWESKANILKNTWTEFVSHMVETDAIKGAIDGVTGAIRFLDSDLGQAAIKAGAFALAFKGVAGIFNAIVSSKALTTIVQFFKAAKSWGIVEALGAVATTIGPIGVALAGIAAVLATPAIVDFFTTDYSEQVEKVKELKNQYEELYGIEGEYSKLLSKQSSETGLTSWEKSRLEFLKQQRAEYEKNLELQKELVSEKYQQEFGRKEQDTNDEDYYRNGGKGKQTAETIDVKNLREAKKAFADLSKEYLSGAKNESEYKSGLDDILEAYSDFYNATMEGIELGALDYSDLTDAQKAILDLYEAIKLLRDETGEGLNVDTVLTNFEEAGNGITQFANQTVVDAAKLKQAFQEAGLSAEDANKTIDELRAGGAIVIDVENDGIDQALANLEELGVAIHDEDGWHIDVEGFQDLAHDLGLSSEQANALKFALSQVDGLSFDGTTESLGKIYDSVNGIINNSPVDLRVTVTDDASGTIGTITSEAQDLDSTDPVVVASVQDLASGIIQEATNLANKFGALRPKPTVGVTDNASTVLGKIIGLLASIKNKAVTVTTTYVERKLSYTGTSSQDLHGHASGTQYFQGGFTLLGDQLSSDGSPRPELIITPTQDAFIAGMSGPTSANLPAGSRIYDWEDTMRILSGGDLSRVAALAGGSGTGGLSLAQTRQRGEKIKAADAKTTDTAKKSNTSSGSGNQNSKTNTSGGNNNAAKTKTSGGGTGGGAGGGGASAQVDELNKQLEILRAEYSLLEASDASTDDLIAKSREIQGLLHTINDLLRSTGGEQKDILGNSTDWYKEFEKIRQVTEELYESQRRLLKTEDDLMEGTGRTWYNRAQERQEIEKTLQALSYGGNANLLAALRSGSDGKATTFWDEENSVALNFTPILLDGDGNYIDTFDEETLKEYAENVISGAHEDILQLQIGSAFSGENALAEAEETARKINGLNEKYVLSLAEDGNTVYEDRVKKLKEIQKSLHEQAEYLRSINADQADINDLSLEWLSIQNRIYDVFQDERDLMDSQFSIMEKENASVSDRIWKLNQIVDSLRTQIDYMRSIGAKQIDINNLYLQQLETQEKILQIQQSLKDELNAAINAELNSAQRARDKSIKGKEEEIKLLRAQIESLEKARNVRDDALELEEKQNAVLEARKALLNALNERSVRFYNASSGQWEWMADSRTVESAQKAFDEAKKTLDEEVKGREQEAATKVLEDKISVLEAEIDSINEQYDSFSSWWDDFSSIFDEPVRDIKEILSDMYDQGLLTDAQVKQIEAYVGNIRDYTKDILNVLSLKEYLQENPNGSYKSWLKYVTGNPNAGEGFSDSLNEFLSNNPDVNAVYTDEEGNEYHSDGTFVSGKDKEKQQSDNTGGGGGYHPGATVVYTDSSGNSVTVTSDTETPPPSLATDTSGGSGSVQTISPIIVSGGGVVSAGSTDTDFGREKSAKEAAIEALKEAIRNKVNSGGGGSSAVKDYNTEHFTPGQSTMLGVPTNHSTNGGGSSGGGGGGGGGGGAAEAAKKAAEDVKKLTPKPKGPQNRGNSYDDGGILKGLGGIKATMDDEIVIPPEIAHSMLSPSADATFKRRMAELGFIYGSSDPIYRALDGKIQNRTSNDHYGDIYQYGNITLTEGQAKGMTVYELAQMSRGLSIYRNI